MVQRKIKTHIQGIHPTGEVLVNVTSLTTETTTEHTVPLNKEHDANLILDLPYSQYHVEAEYTGDEGNQPVSHETILDFRKQPRIESENDFWIWMAKWGIVPSVLQIQYNIYDENNNLIRKNSFDELGKHTAYVEYEYGDDGSHTESGYLSNGILIDKTYFDKESDSKLR